MSDRLHRAVTRWLRAEERGGMAEAESALRRVFALLPMVPMPAGFAAGVWRRSGLRVPAPRVWLDTASRPVRAALCVGLLLGGLSILLLPGTLPALLALAGVVDLGGVGVGAVVEIVRRLGSGLLVWKALSGVGGAMIDVLGSARALAAALFASLVCAGAFRLLHELMVSERSSRHAGSV